MMSPEKVKALEDKYQFFRPVWGVECGDGWFEIIDELCKMLSALGLRGAKVEFIKEKFGGLRVGLSHIGGKNYDDILSVIEHAYNRSMGTCEECGQSGILRDIRGWLKTLCDGCFAKRLSQTNV